MEHSADPTDCFPKNSFRSSFLKAGRAAIFPPPLARYPRKGRGDCDGDSALVPILKSKRSIWYRIGAWLKFRIWTPNVSQLSARWGIKFGIIPSNVSPYR